MNNRIYTGGSRGIGSRYEDMAAAYLEGHGGIVLQRNFSCRTGEVDIIARDGDYLVFVEVKYRRTTAHGDPFEAVSVKKQRRIIGAALYYMSKHRISPDTPIRFDVIGISGDGRVAHLRNAFTAGL